MPMCRTEFLKCLPLKLTLACEARGQKEGGFLPLNLAVSVMTSIQSGRRYDICSHFQQYDHCMLVPSQSGKMEWRRLEYVLALTSALPSSSSCNTASSPRMSA